MTTAELWAIYKAYVYWLVTVADWGNVPGWITAVIALLALGVATVGGIAAWRSNQAQQHTIEMQREQLDMARDQAERAQASKVMFFVPGEPLPETAINRRGVRVPSVAFANTFRLFNVSDGPVFELTLFDDVNGGRLLFASMHLLPTGGDPPARQLTIVKKFPHIACKLHFRDSAGLYWVRDHRGNLSRATEAETATTRHLAKAWANLDAANAASESQPVVDKAPEGPTDGS